MKLTEYVKTKEFRVAQLKYGWSKREKNEEVEKC